MKRLLFFFLLLSQAAYSQLKNDFSLEDIFKKNTFTPKKISGLHSLKDGKTYVSIETDPETKQRYVAKNSYVTGKPIARLFYESQLVYNGQQLPLSTGFNDEENKVLITKDEEAIYRRSTKANYFVYDIKNRNIIAVSSKGKQMYATFSPDGSKIAFVRDNNLFITDLLTGTEKQVTTDGKQNKIINGATDWVYEEEFSMSRAFFWSPDSKKIAYYRFDESQVPEFGMNMYEGLYPIEYRYKYPKAGEKNSEVSICIVNIENNRLVSAETGPEKDQYIPRIRWTADPEKLCILRLNRHQNKLEYLLTDISDGKTRVMMTETDRCYINIEKEHLYFLDNGKQFINLSERDGNNHLYLYDLDGHIIRQITRGSWDVTDIYGIDEKNKKIYYQSTERSLLQRDVYSVSFDGTSGKRLSNDPGTNTATFSNDFSYFILSHSTVNSPDLITLNDHTGKLIRVLEDNAALNKDISDLNISKTTFFSFKTSQGIDLNGYMIRPPDFSAFRKYPVLMYVYGGPGSQNVADSWGGLREIWLKYLAQKGYIIVSVDNRGTGFRGAAFERSTYKNLGGLETSDQIETAKWLASQNYVDASRIGIWGWSFGGYLSSLCITQGAGIFKMAIAVAPVTNWRFYDSIYTERYLQTPQENSEGYDNNSPINFADKLRGCFLLIHGTGDDNVHFQNSVMFSEALIQAGKLFEQAYYPNKTHSISGGNTTFQLYSKMSDFIVKNL